MQASYAYPRQNRLLKPKEFERVFNKPFKKVGSFLVCFSRKNELARARLGLVITKRRFKRAVDRNKIRRLVRESFRLYSSQLGAVDIIILTKTMTLSQIQTDLKKELVHYWKKLALEHSRNGVF